MVLCLSRWTWANACCKTESMTSQINDSENTSFTDISCLNYFVNSNLHHSSPHLHVPLSSCLFNLTICRVKAQSDVDSGCEVADHHKKVPVHCSGIGVRFMERFWRSGSLLHGLIIDRWRYSGCVCVCGMVCVCGRRTALQFLYFSSSFCARLTVLLPRVDLGDSRWSASVSMLLWRDRGSCSRTYGKLPETLTYLYSDSVYVLFNVYCSSYFEDGRRQSGACKICLWDVLSGLFCSGLFRWWMLCMYL